MTERIEKHVLTVMPDVCEKNGKDPKATELLAKMAAYGKVEPYEQVINAVTAEYQEALGNTRAQLNAIKEQELTVDEISLLNAYRACKASNAEAFEKEITALKTCLEDVRDSSKKRAEQIAQLVAELQEANA